jgi:DNA-binding CsgD family transcriptional regulator/PAS domain-containing protein
VLAVPRTGKCPSIPLETFSKVVESIYDCALDQSAGQDTLGVIVECCCSSNGGLGVHDVENRSTELTYSVGITEHYQRLNTEYAVLNPFHVPLQLVPVERVITSADLVDQSELLESRFYREFLKPQGICNIAGFNVLMTGPRIGAFTVHRRDVYGEAELRLLGLLAPHVCRSVAISDALNLKTVPSDALEATLDALAAGVYLTDREGRVVYMNRNAEHQVKTSNAVRIVNNRLTAVDYTACSALAKAITEATLDEAEPLTGGITIALPAGEDAGLVAAVLPLNRGERQNIGGSFAATAAIFVQDPVVVPPFPGEAFAKLYDLTGSELRVLLAMAPGLSVKEAAEMLGISHTTAKSHLQHIYSKTGTSKQTELMHLFMSSTPPVGTA